jgi:hypothetical protein
MVIPLKKRTSLVMALGAFAFVAVAAWQWSVADTHRTVDPLLAKVVSLVAIGFFAVCGIYLVRRVFDTRPGLVLDRDGILDHSSGVAVGRIPWDDITNVKVSSIAGQAFVTIEVVDPGKYSARGGALRRKLHAANVRLTGSPINISASLLPVTLDEIVEAIALRRAQHLERR